MFNAISGQAVGWKASKGCGLTAIDIAKKLFLMLVIVYTMLVIVYTYISYLNILLRFSKVLKS